MYFNNFMSFVVVSLLIVCTFAGCKGKGAQQDNTVPVVSFPKHEGSEVVSWFQAYDGRYGLRDKDGNEILKPVYDDVGPFAEGLAAVNMGAEFEFPGILEGGTWGYINESGELVIPLQFAYANDFSDGLARVRSTGAGTIFIDTNGVVKLRIPDANSGDFREGIAPVHRGPSLPGQDQTTQYINKEGEVQFTVTGYANEFHEGLAVFSIRGGKAKSNANRSYGFIDATGTEVIEPVFGEARHFSDGLAAVRTKKTTIYRMGDTWGYIDKTGEYVIDPIYNEARPFRDGEAIVHEGGELVDVSDGPCYWEGGQWWLIDTTGNKIGRIEK